MTMFLLKALFLNSLSRFLMHRIKNYNGPFCDLPKSFDNVSHELLILKLEFYGVKGCILNWFKSYLHNRRQRVVFQFVNSFNVLSEWEIVRHGVPQGCFGPITIQCAY